MILAEAAKTGAREIWTNKTRSVLSFAAISVGVASLLYTLAQTRGMKEAQQKTFELMGPGRVTVEAKSDHVEKGVSPGLTYEDALAIRREIPGLYMVYPKVRQWGQRLRYGKASIDDVWLDAVTADWRKRDWVFTLRGRFFDDYDVRTAARVCVLLEPGGWLKKPFWALFWNWEPPYEAFIKHRDMLGRQIELGDHLFTVVGVLRQPYKDKDPRWFSWEDPHVIVPVTAYHRFLKPAWDDKKSATAVDEIRIDTGSERGVDQVKQKIAALLKVRHKGEEDFELKDMREEIEHELSQSKKNTAAATVLGLVAMLAGGIGIMNVTLATIFARVKEIGVRRALGAARADIVAQFVVEAALLGVAGGAAGIALGTAGISYLAKNTDRDLAQLAWFHFPIAVAAASAVSALFSLYPAYQASRLDPVEALKSE